MIAVIMFSWEGMFFYCIPGTVSFVVKGEECVRYNGQESRVCTPTEMYAMKKAYENEGI